MKNILVPTDFSAESHHAFEVAVQVAQRTGASVLLLHVLEGPDGPDFSTYGGPVGGSVVPNSDTTGMERVFMLKLLEVTKRRLQNLIDEAQAMAPGVTVRELMQMGRIGDTVLRVIRDQHMDLVVMGAQGHGAVEHFFSGSNTERLIRLAPCPVLAVKHQQASFDVKHILFPSNFSAEADQAVDGLRQVQALFPGAAIHLLHVVDNASAQQAAQARIQDFAQRHQLANAVPQVIAAGSASAGIQRFAEQSGADLVVMPTHARTGLSRYFQASIAENVATHAFPPVLTFHLR